MPKRSSNANRPSPRPPKGGWNTRMNVPCQGGGNSLRVFERKRTKTHSPRLLVKCGDCDQRVEIWFGDGSLEIGGVIASVPEWRRVLGPLLRGRGW